MDWKRSGVTTHPDDRTGSCFRVSVSCLHGKLHVWLEDKTTKEQWQTEQLSLADFVTTENAVPRATLANYAEWVTQCLHGSGRSTWSEQLEANSRRLRVWLPLETLGITTSLEYSFCLTMMEQQPMDLVVARLRDVEETTKKTATEVERLRLEFEDSKRRGECANVKDDVECKLHIFQEEITELKRQISKQRVPERKKGKSKFKQQKVHVDSVYDLEYFNDREW